MLKLLTDSANFKEFINSEELVIVDFYADWCGPCKMLSPVLDKVAVDMDVKVLKVDVDVFTEIAKEYEIRSIPAVKMFKGGSIVNEFVGFKPEPLVKRIVSDYKN